MKRSSVALFVLIGFAMSLPRLSAAEWQPVTGKIMTRWAKVVSPDNVHREYPRPQMVREKWTNLNGLWDYAIRPKAEARPEKFDGQILVPFPIESALSGVAKKVGEGNQLWYSRKFSATKPADGSRWLLHFGAVDWQATVFVNGTEVGKHTGGYDPFSFDITAALKDGNAQELTVRVWDPTDKGYQPRGKQVNNPNSIWYTPVTGIWQTVWLEPVPALAIESFVISTDIDKRTVSINGKIHGTPGDVTVSLSFPGQVPEVTTASVNFQLAKNSDDFSNLALTLPNAKLWTPDQPNLHKLRLTISRAGKEIDRIDSYCALRKIELAKDKAGINRLMLNHEPLFQYGPLDQGWWPDGLYTPPTDAALRYDVEYLKEIGCNMIRKHVKVEPLRWYYHCDQIGMLVWQDMPSGDKYIGARDPDIKRSAESTENFEREWKAIIDALRNCPCIVMWVPFNEGWGQFDTARIVDLTKRYDPTRLVNNASGWTDRGVGDVNDAHIYPGPGMPKVEEKRAIVLGEFGGLGLPLEGHTWLEKGNWGYRSFKTQDELVSAYEQLIFQLRPLIGQGLCAAVYTQTTDVEIEVNGMLTYDRAVVKIPLRLTKLHKTLYLPPPSWKTVVPTSESEPQTWKYTTQKPEAEWTKPDFADKGWTSGPGGFGTAITPNTKVRTEWKSNDIWIRRTFELKDAKLNSPAWKIFHDEDTEIYLNGEKVLTMSAYSSSYVTVPFSDAAQKALKSGMNTLAVHCKQTVGGQFIDVGILEEAPADTSK